MSCIVKFVALILLVAVFAGAGFDKVSNPAKTAAIIRSSTFPKYLAKASTAVGVKIPFGEQESVMFAQAIGGAMILFSAQVVIGVFRAFAAFNLAAILVAITAFMHVDLENPAKTSESNLIQCFKNASIIGGLLYVAASSCCASSQKCAVKPTGAADKKKKH